jgi:hypothetical protein
MFDRETTVLELGDCDGSFPCVYETEFELVTGDVRFSRWTVASGSDGYRKSAT